MPSSGQAGDGKIYVEFVTQGSVVKVTAIDPASGIEASIMGPSGASRVALSDAAVRKLRYLQQKKSGG
ncbi:MAG TPA: hypothetical protein VHZ78_06445 [Rhizomicrobium sp.]|jgi:hypothetical protein|nr:hypothetical protein [Rhizomicrobium sp.]